MHTPTWLIFALTAAQCALACLHDHSKSDHFKRTAEAQLRHSRALQANKTALINVRIFDGYKVGKSRTIVVDGDIISYDMTNVDNILDGEGGVLMAGLIDSHSHPQSIADLEALSSYGVTTVMNMACPSYALCASLRNQPGLTSFLASGYPAIGPNSVHSKLLNTPASSLIYSPAQAPEAVSWAFGNGSNYYKIVAEANGPNQATQNALVTYTHRAGQRAMTHAASIAYYIQAILSKTDGVQHIPGDGLINQTMINRMIQNNQYNTPTMALVKAFISNPQLLAKSAYTNTSWATVTANVRALHDAGVKISAGTDAVGYNPVLNFSHPFGLTLHQELGYLVEAGLTNAEALRAATIVPAILNGLYDRGVVQAGKRADLILLGSNPLQNISATLDIRRVWNAGVEYTNISINPSG